MTDEEYEKMQKALLKEAQRRYDKTLEDLKIEMDKSITKNDTK